LLTDQREARSKAMSTSSSMTVGIIGAGNIGQAFARVTTRAGRNVIISNSSGPEALEPLVEGLGAGVSAGTVDAAAAAPIVVIAVPWPSIPNAVADLTWDGQIVIDATNAVNVTFEGDAPTFTPAELGGKTSSELVAGLGPGARVVKAGNTLLASVLAADPRESGGNRVLFISGDDKTAKDDVAALFTAADFFPIDLGGLVEGGRMQQMLTGPLAAMNLVKLP
jgi:predicted dinucleotide-binding enzyme